MTNVIMMMMMIMEFPFFSNYNIDIITKNDNNNNDRDQNQKKNFRNYKLIDRVFEYESSSSSLNSRQQITELMIDI